MEGELIANFFISETKRDFDQVQQNHFNSFKKLVDLPFFRNIRQRDFDSATQASCWVTLTSMGPKLQSQNRVDVDYEKTVGLGAWLTKAL